MNFRSIVHHIESLPPLSDTTQVVRKIYQDGAENVDISKLVRAIETDVALTVNILKMINSPLYGFSKQITSVSQAVTLFGTQVVYGLVVRYSIESAIIANLRPYGLSNSKFNDICHMQSALMSQWYSKVNLKDAQFLAPLALVMESGKLVVAQEVTQHTNIKEFINGLRNAPNLSEYENSLFGTSSYYISGLLFEHWNLDTLYVDMLKGLDFEHDGALKLGYYIDILDIVRTAVNVVNIFTKESIREASEIVADMGLDVEYFKSVCISIKETYIKNDS
ncbi:HDOD domain-containing protein [Sulfurimonas sp. SAG-AH-194-C21]|nr:HDOD domain-containing protein [Sulfurimonas sp. SAG-AH-194-C21]MDF1883539.1 HDOD domain-containing protein [Sulfurimonas sp. SAG-AH-194-C21]